VLPDAGASSTWTRAMGVEACRVALQYVRDETDTRLVVDPFCGRGTLLAVAEAMGLPSLGIEISARRCRAARSLVVTLPASAVSKG
jgi:DNA modification methylase